LTGILDDDPALVGGFVGGLPVVGTLAEAKRFGDSQFISGIANVRDPGLRLKIAGKMDLPADRWATFIHPSAVVVDSGAVGPDSIVYPGAMVSGGARLGAHSVMYYNSVLHHDAFIGDGCCICASVTLAGHVNIGKGCYLGAGSAVKEYVKIGDGSLIGMGAVVLDDMPPDSRVAGVPAHRILKKART
jgi:sugar O-acyltransferase (sialic acid O-acetyltransferase NeuD family)